MVVEGGAFEGVGGKRRREEGRRRGGEMLEGASSPPLSFGLEVVWPLAPLGLVSSSEISGLGGREAAITSSSCSIAPTTWKWWQMLLLLWMLKLAGTSLF